MMDVWITFVFASIVILIIPGPTIIFVISQSVAHGKDAIIPLVTGVLLGDLIAMTLSLLGLGAILSTSTLLFTTLKLLGALYLCYLGVKLFLKQPEVISESKRVNLSRSKRSFVKSSFIVTVLNPKSIAFFVAFFPQFINPANSDIFQLIIFGGTFLLLATINAALYSLFASQIKEHIQQKDTQKWFNRLGGSVLIGTAIFTAATRQSA